MEKTTLRILAQLIEKPAPVRASIRPVELSESPIQDNTKTNVEINICWGEYYKGKWTSPKSTELNRPLTIDNLDVFDAKKLLMVGRIERTEKPEGKFRERLIINLKYDYVTAMSSTYFDSDGNRVSSASFGGGGGKFIFTSKNAPPLVSNIRHDNDLITDVVFPTDKLFMDASSEYSSNNNHIENSRKTFKINVEQPDNRVTSELTETIFTKKAALTNGFNVLPIHHPIENQFEAPLFYADERSTLFAKPTEKISRFRDVDIYYPVLDIPVRIYEPPAIIDEPIPDWPPIDVLGPDIEDIVTNPWRRVNSATNPNINAVIPTGSSFQFGNAVFGESGSFSNALFGRRGRFSINNDNFNQ